MPLWIRRKEKLEVLRERYHKLMKKAFEIAPFDKVKSDKLNAEATQLLKEIKILMGQE